MIALCDIKGNKLYFEDCEQYIIKKRGFRPLFFFCSTWNLLYNLRNSYNNNYFEAGRRLRVRSILNVCEQPEIEPDAKRVLLDNF